MELTIPHFYDYAGEYIFYIELDPDNVVDESEENNNIETYPYFVDGYPDLVPSLVGYKQTNKEIEFTFNVYNPGNKWVDEYTYDIQFGDSTGTGGIITETLMPEQNYTFKVIHEYPDFDDYNLTFELDPLNLIEELNEGNNKITESITLNQILIEFQGQPKINSTMYLTLTSIGDEYLKYTLGMALGSTPGTQLSDGRVIPLNMDQVMQNMMNNPSQYGFFDSTGTLDQNGQATVTWNIPNVPNQVGKTVYLAFVSRNMSIPMPHRIISISDAYPVTLIR
jgi:hypothetical protein